MAFLHQAKHFSQARRVLMLPHSRGEAESIADAFGLISNGFHRLDAGELDDQAAGWTEKIKVIMDTSGLQDTQGIGLFAVRAAHLTDVEKHELSNLVDRLARWFDRKSQTRA